MHTLHDVGIQQAYSPPIQLINMTRQSKPALVKDPDALAGRANRPTHRDEQLTELDPCFSADLRLVHPLHAWLHGSPGTGKTLSAHYLLTQHSEAGRIPAILVNCRERFTFLSVVEAILDAVKPLRSPQRTRERQLHILRSELVDRRCVIVLDEVDVLELADLTDLLHQLCGLPKASVICIAASRQLLLKLPDAVKSRFAPRQVLFPRYVPEELVGILQPTVEKALEPGAWTKETIHRIADLAYGDARRALALLRHAIQRAEEAGASSIGPEHLHVANFEHYDPDIEDLLGSLSTHYRLLHDLVARSGPIPPKLLDELKAAMEHADVDYLAEEIPRAIQQSLEGIERVSKIVRAMKEFSHPAQEKTAIDINRAIQATITIATNEWKYVAEMETDFDPDLPRVPCLPGDFNQVILNIVVNAAQAIADVVGDRSEGKGRITIRTRRVNDWAEIRIADTGTGIPEEIRHRIFDPFFTTKGIGKGTGQGLNLAHTIVAGKHGGTLSVESEPGQRTCFLIRLPLGAPSASPEAMAEEITT